MALSVFQSTGFFGIIIESPNTGGYKWESKNAKSSLFTSLTRNKKFKKMGIGYFGLVGWKEQ